MNLIDLLYGRSHNSAKGKIHLRNLSGEPVTITKEMRYTVTDGHSNTTSTVTMTCSNTAVAPGTPIVPVKHFDRQKSKETPQ